MFEIEVINSPLKAKKKSLGGGTSYAVIDIEPLIIWNTIPKKENLLPLFQTYYLLYFYFHRHKNFVHCYHTHQKL